MKKWNLILSVLVLLGMLAACASPAQQEILDTLEGTWSSADEKLQISGTRVEVTGYYELDGRRMAGVAIAGTLTVQEDGTLSIDFQGYVREGRLQEDGSLLLGSQVYRK